jgi:DNA-binding GntR family transcriptional regulator
MTTPLPQAPRLRYKKLSDEIAGLLQQMILDDRLVAGQKVTQDELAKQLGVSTMPVREALLQLSAMGLVDAAPNKSFRVMTSTKEDVEDSYWMHATVASELTRRACLLKGPALVPELQSAFAAYTKAAEQDDHEMLVTEYDRFYRAINLAADSRRLLFILRTNLQFLPIRWFPQIDGWIPLSRASHKRLIEAFKTGNADKAAEVARTHMQKAGELLIAHYEAAGRWAPKP